MVMETKTTQTFDLSDDDVKDAIAAWIEKKYGVGKPLTVHIQFSYACKDMVMAECTRLLVPPEKCKMETSHKQKNLHPNGLVALIQMRDGLYPEEPLHPNALVALRQLQNLRNTKK